MTDLTDAQAVRLRVGDTGTGDDQIFSDDEIAYFLSENGDVVLMASADALEASAASTALIAKLTRTGELTIDRKAVPAELRKLAEQLREQARSAPACAVSEWAVSEFTGREILAKSGDTTNY